jgi:hypothetical protein
LWRRLAGTTLLLSSLGAAPTATAQLTFYPATTPDRHNASSPNISNTGADHIPLAGNTLRVTCWDGQNPQVGWSYGPGNGAPELGEGHTTLLGSRQGTIIDPDIVADAGNFGTNGNRQTDVFIAYELNGGIYYEMMRFDARTRTLTNVGRVPTLLVPASEGGSNPNVDIDGQGHVALTWSQWDPTHTYQAIYLRTLDLNTGTFSDPCEVAGEPGFTCSLPDVALYHTGEQLISLVFLATDPGGNQSVRMTQISRIIVENYAQYGTNFYGAGIEVLPGVFGSFGSPRIATPTYSDWYTTQNATNGDFQVVVAEAGSNQIYGLNRVNSRGNMLPYQPSTLPTVQVLNSAGGLSAVAECRQPVVTYCADIIEVAWTLSDTRPPFVRNGNQEVVATLLTVDGTPQNTGGWYSIVNENEFSDQNTPSLAGRFAANLPAGAPASSNTNEVFYCFSDPMNWQIGYKSSAAGNISLRTAATPAPKMAQPLSAYPNPFQEQTTLTLTLAKGETVQSMQVVDAQGQPVRGLKLPKAGATGDQQVRWNAAGLKPGLYLVQLRTSTGALHTYRVQHE